MINETYVQANEGTFLFVDGTEVNNGNWGLREPNDQGGHEDCVVTNYDDNRGKWNDKDCNILRPFLCQKPAKGERNRRGVDGALEYMNRRPGMRKRKLKAMNRKQNCRS